MPWWRRAAEPSQARAEPRLEVAARPKMRVSPTAVAYASAQPKQKVNPFVVVAPPPGVVPEAETLAQDSAITVANDYAAGAIPFGGDGPVWLGYAYLAELAQMPEYRRLSEIIAKEMTRKWIRLSANGDKSKTDRLNDLDAAMRRFRVQDAFRRCAELDGFFGRAHLYFDTGYASDDPELRTPLVIDPAKIGRGGLKALKVIEPVWTYPTGYNATDPLHKDFYRPNSWFVMGKQVHASRLMTFVGREMPDLLKPAYQFGGLSLSQMARPYIEHFLRTRDSVSDLIHSFSVMVLKTNLSATLDGGDGDDIIGRAQIFNQTRDNRGLFAIDKEREEFGNVSAPLGTLDQLQAQSQEQIASVCGIPLVKLLGIQPSGLNASSDGEIRSFYDWIHAQQEHLFRHQLHRVLEVIQLSEFGEIDPDIHADFEPLWQLDEAALAAVRKTNADTALEMIEAGVISPEEERRRLANEDGGAYDGLDPDDLPAPPQGIDPKEIADPESNTLDREGEEAGGGVSGS